MRDRVLTGGTRAALRVPAPATDPVAAAYALLAAVVVVLPIIGLAGLTAVVPSAFSASTGLLAAGPAIGAAVAVFHHPPVPPLIRPALAVSCAIAGCGLWYRYAGLTPLVAFAPMAAAGSAFVTSRNPAAAVALIVVFSGTHASFELYTSFPVGPFVDLLIVGLWLGFLWSRLTGTRAPAGALHPGLWVLVAFVAISLVYALVAENQSQGLYGFRAMCWYMLAAALVSVLLADVRQQRILFRGFVIAGAIVGGYAVLRWIIGPGAKELEVAQGGGPYVYDTAGENVRLIGSLLNPSLLGAWCAPIISFCVAAALFGRRNGWRLLALIAAGTCLAAQFGAESRVSIVGSATGILTALALLGLARGVSGRRVVPLTVGLLLAAVAGGAFATVELSDPESRFRGLLNVTNDYSFQDRVNKWKSVLADMEDHPFGHGVGSAGIAELRYARFRTIGTFDPDSSYVKVAYEQGYVMMGVFIVVVIALILALGIRAVGTADPWTSQRAAAGCAAVVALAVTMTCGMYNEGLSPFTVWLAAALGLAPIVRSPRADDATSADA